MLDAVCAYYDRRFGVKILPEQIMSCYGTQEGVGHLAMALCNPGDIVLLPDPCYPVFQAGSLLAEAEPYYYPLNKENGFLPRVAEIPEDIAKKAKYIIVSLPSNPVGSIAEPHIYEEIVAWAKKYDVLVAAAQPDRLRHVSSHSESGGCSAYRFSGFRKGTVRGVPETERRSVRRCPKIGWNIPDAQGSMFVWAPIPDSYTSSMEFCMDLLEKTGVLCARRAAASGRTERAM